MMNNNPNFPHFPGNQGQANPPRFSRDSHNHMKSNLYSQAINLHPNENFSPPHNESFASSNYSQSGRAKKKIFEPLGPPEQINLSYRSEINHQPSLSLHQTRSTPQNNAQNLFLDNFQNTQPLSSKLPQPSPRSHHHNPSLPNYYSGGPDHTPYMNQDNLHPQMFYENRSTTPTRSPIRNKHAPQDLNINVPPSPNSQFQNQNQLPPSPHSQFNNLNYPQKSPHAQHNKNFIPEEDFHSTRPQPQPHPQNHPNQQFQFPPDNNNYVNAVDFDGMSMISGTSSRRRTKPIVILNINVGNGQTDELKLFDGENPEDVVNSFCMKYKLPTHIQPVLLQNLSLQASRFYEVRAQKLQQRMLNRTQPNILEEDQSLMAQANNLQSQRAHTETAADYYSGERQQPGGYGNGRKNSYVDMNEPQRSNRQQQQQQKPTTPRSGGQGYQSNQGGVVPPSDRNRERNASRSPIGYQEQYQKQYEEPQQKQYREPKQQSRGPQQQQYREPPQQQQQSYREPKQQQQQYREPPQQPYREPLQQQYREPAQQQQSYREPQRSQRNIPNIPNIPNKQQQETRSWNQLDESEIDGNGNDYYEDRSQASSSTPNTQVFDKLYEQGMRNKERKELIRDDLQKQMNSKNEKELTFQPQINKNTRAIIPKRQSRIEDELWKDAEQRRERQAKAQQLKEKLEMEGFTGTPKINTGKRPTQPRATQSKSPVHSSNRFDDNPPPARKPERVKNSAVENNNNRFVPTINRKSNAMAEKNRNNNMTPQDNIHQNLYEDGLRKHKSINQIDERPSFDPKTNQELFKPKINKSNPYYQKAANKRDSTFVVEEIAVDQDQLEEAIATRSTRSIRPSYNQNRESKSVGPITSSGKKSTAQPKTMSKQNISKDNSFSHYDERDNYPEENYVQPSNSSNKKVKEEELSVGSFHSNKKASIFVSEPEREKLIEIFQALDDNHDGIITVQDIDVSNLDPNVIEAISDVLFALEGVSMMTFDDFAKAVYDMKVIVALREIYGLPAAENPYQANKIVFSPEKGILKTSQPEYRDELSDYLFAEKDTAPESRDPRASELDSRDNRGTSRSPNRKTQKSVVFADSDSDSKGGLTKRYQALVDKSFSGKK